MGGGETKTAVNQRETEWEEIREMMGKARLGSCLR